ncbi:LacI family transcriptional regulator [Aureimonas flava]|uniref:LacI family transcriptional regulator n=1 Tax=Aureimonas flava TaxID=2320271 RepID=A0A3A1WIC9_9HYPH|nr:LacI family transcriptional regulator [Aureimonas flava]RIY00713.1 LacI family transcriptional regulator [Aureimonas flava]
MSPPTIGVVAVVSRACTPGGHVPPADRERIDEAAQAVGYRPNIVARSLSTRRANTIAVAMTRPGTRSLPTVRNGLGNELQATGSRCSCF